MTVSVVSLCLLTAARFWSREMTVSVVSLCLLTAARFWSREMTVSEERYRCL